MLKRIPLKSRISVARRLATLVEQVVTRNDIPAWLALLQFPTKCLFTPPRGGKRWNLASLVNNQVLQESHSIQNEAQNPQLSRRPGRPKASNKAPIDLLAARVSGKLEEGNYRGAVRLACSEDVTAEHNGETLEALKDKHPLAHPGSQISDLSCNATL